jgi:hypothetical protein
MILYVLFALMQKEPKKSRPNQTLRWFGPANAHEQSSKLVNTFCYRIDGLKLLLRVYLQLMEALSFSFAIFKDVSALSETKKKALVNFSMIGVWDSNFSDWCSAV